jgi:ribonucleoside-diphosphate reductase alpha chain
MKTQRITQETQQEKYFKGTETTTIELYRRVSTAIAGVEEPSKAPHWGEEFLNLLDSGNFISSGRIASAAGSELDKATLISCFVQPVGDAITGVDDEGRPSIYTAISESAETMRRGGGVGYNFSPIRPANAVVKGTKSRASGPLSYMRVFSSSCSTVESAGARRGAQMGLLNVNHPDIFAFIRAKTDGEFSNFNLSVGVSSAFMQAVSEEADWDLVHVATPSVELIANGAYQKGDIWVYETVSAAKLYDEIMKHAYYHAEPGVLLLDNINKENNLYYCESIDACNPCGEQALPPYGCCNLGAVNLSRMVKNPFKKHPECDDDEKHIHCDVSFFDYEQLKIAVKKGIRFLDNVLDATTYPLDKQRDESMSKRRIGLGITGLGSALVLLNTRYDSQEGRSFAENVMRIIRDTAYRASIELAKEKGAFPLFNADKYLDSAFVSRLPDDIREDIKEYGIRNSHLLSIAPTGTISLAFGDVCSNGIEPVFDWSYNRRKVMEDGGIDSYTVHDYAMNLARSMGIGEEAIKSSNKTAREISARNHLAMMKAVQPYVDSAISKTINLPSDYPMDDFKNLYMEAHVDGLKGVAVYRDGSIAGAVLSSLDDKEEKSETIDPDRRLQLKALPESTLKSLRWVDRPECPAGNLGWSYMINHPQGKFALFVGQYDNGSSWPFECWINGVEAPRYLGSLAKTLSADMRSNDRQWLKLKLDSLEKVVGEDSFHMAFPPIAKKRQVPSLVSGMAQLIRYRFEELNAFESQKETPMVDALMSLKEPKSGSAGTLSWSWDVLNPQTGEDFVLTLKELRLPDGQIRPFSMWLSNRYPRVLDGLCKLLSLDMRVTDPAWIGLKLRKLVNYAEPMGDFLAPEPGTGNMRSQPSTVAYIARLVLYRFMVLGILDERGFPVGSAEFKVKYFPTAKGKACPECHCQTLFKKDGCEACECGYIGSCG